MIRGADIVSAARKRVGVPFAHQGRSEFGMDCIGLVVLSRNDCEPWPEALAQPSNYRRNPQAGLEKGLDKYCTQIDAAEAGCLALIRWPKQLHAAHVGIVTPENIIHAYATQRLVVETGYRAHWLRWTVGWWRLPGVQP